MVRSGPSATPFICMFSTNKVPEQKESEKVKPAKVQIRKLELTKHARELHGLRLKRMNDFFVFSLLGRLDFNCSEGQGQVYSKFRVWNKPNDRDEIKSNNYSAGDCGSFFVNRVAAYEKPEFNLNIKYKRLMPLKYLY